MQLILDPIEGEDRDSPASSLKSQIEAELESLNRIQSEVAGITERLSRMQNLLNSYNSSNKGDDD